MTNSSGACCSSDCRSWLQDEKQALHECVRVALDQTQKAAVADRAAEAAGQEGSVDAAVLAQIQQRRNQQVTMLSLLHAAHQMQVPAH